MYYIRIVQSKLTDFINIKRNSIEVPPHFFRLLLKEWRRKNLPDNIDKEISIGELVKEILFYSIQLYIY